MRYTIREVNGDRIQCTYPDERWYARRVNENAAWDFVPSVTWVADYWPKGIGFYKWLAQRSWDESEAIKAAAGEKGSKVHQAIGLLIEGGRVAMDDAFENPRTMEPETLTPAEYECLMSFVEWFREVRPEVVANEYTVWNEHYRYAGTVDLLCRIDGRLWLIDFKTSADIWMPMELQISAYKHAQDMPESQRRKIRLGILQVGYRRNKTKKWKFTEIPDRFKLFLATRKIWEHETAGQKPLQKDYPLSLSLAAPARPEIRETELEVCQ